MSARPVPAVRVVASAAALVEGSPREESPGGGSPLDLEGEIPTHEFPLDLLGAPCGGELDHTETLQLSFDWDRHEIRFHGRIREEAEDRWMAFERHLSLSLAVTAAGPSSRRSIHVAAVSLRNGVTVLERWTVESIDPLPEGGYGVRLSSRRILASAALTHVRALAVAPHETFLLFLHHESGEIRKLDLSALQGDPADRRVPETAIATVLSPLHCPALSEQRYQAIDWYRHETEGDVFELDAMPCSSATGPYLLLWDQNLDGIPERIEEDSVDMERSEWLYPRE